MLLIHQKKNLLISIVLFVLTIGLGFMISCKNPSIPESTSPALPIADTSLPNLVNLQAPATIRDNEALNLTVTVSDSGGGTHSLSLLDGTTVLAPLTVQSGNTYTINYSGLACATYTNLRLRATDEAGNSGTLAIPSLRVQSTDACLSFIASTVGTLSPAFTPETTVYFLHVPSGSIFTIYTFLRSPTATKVLSQTGSNPMFAYCVATAEAGYPYFKIYQIVIYIP